MNNGSHHLQGVRASLARLTLLGRRGGVVAATLLLLVAFGAGLRFWDLGRRGHIVPDERYLARQAREFVYTLNTMTLSVRTQAERHQKIAELVGLIKHINNALAKPGHEVLSAVAFGLFKRRHPPL